MSTILACDKYLFHLFNGVLTHPFVDVLMLVITDAKIWVPLFVVIWLLLFFYGGKKGRSVALLLLIVVGISDQVSSSVVKKIVKRKRPCCVEQDVRLLVHCKKSKSFPSSHATNTAAVAATAWLEGGAGIGVPLALIALLVGYSRVYIGVHYPFDVAAGWLLGLLVAFLCVKIYRAIYPRIFAENSEKSVPADGSPAPTQQGKVDADASESRAQGDTR